MQRKIKIDSKKYTKSKIITAKQNEEYLLIDENTNKSPNKVKLIKVDNNLEVYFEGNEYYPSVIIQDYYAENMNTSIVGINSSSNLNTTWENLEISEKFTISELPLWASVIGITTVVGGSIILIKDHLDDKKDKEEKEALSSHVSPIVLDLNNDGINTISISHGIQFDINGDSKIEATGWIDKKDGFLVLDINKDEIINNGSELFGEGTILTNGTKAKNGYDALAQYDLNEDNLIDSNDNIFNLLQVWIDKNEDGISSKDELFTLSQLGIKSLSLDSKNNDFVDNENIIGLVSSWKDTNNNNHKMADVWFQTSEINLTKDTYLPYHSFINQTNISEEQTTYI
jgi:hypothetical protein